MTKWIQRDQIYIIKNNEEELQLNSRGADWCKDTCEQAVYTCRSCELYFDNCYTSTKAISLEPSLELGVSEGATHFEYCKGKWKFDKESFGHFNFFNL